MAGFEGYSSLRTGRRCGRIAAMPTAPRQVVLVAYDGVQLLDLAGPLDVFDAATRALVVSSRDPEAAMAEAAAEAPSASGYELVVATPAGRDARTLAGPRLSADAALADLDPAGIDTLLVAGALDMEAPLVDAGLLAAIPRLAADARRTCSVCGGAFLLAAAGLLDGRRATTHWAGCAQLASRFPAVSVEPDRIYVRDGAVVTSAGVTAGMDLALALVEEDHGTELARTVARWLVLFLQRPGGQSQFSQRLAVPLPTGSPIRGLVEEIVADPAADHSVPALAGRAALSERHLARLFAEHAGTTPGRFVERVRVEAARDLLEGGNGAVEEVARRCGFGSAETMRRGFLRVLGVGPAEYRRRFRTAELPPLAGAATA
jgi:transcriptional regulator GlxA family with amidase domain